MKLDDLLEEIFNVFGENNRTWMGLTVNINSGCFSDNDYTKFQEVMADMQDIINNNPKKTPLFYVLVYRLSKIHNGIALYYKIDEMGMKQFFKWNRNRGLVFLPTNEKLAGKMHLK